MLGASLAQFRFGSTVDPERLQGSGLFHSLRGQQTPVHPCCRAQTLSTIRNIQAVDATEALTTQCACRSYSKSFATIGLLYSGIECCIEKHRGKHDWQNSLYTGFLTGGLLARGSALRLVHSWCTQHIACQAVCSCMPCHVRTSCRRITH